MNLQCQLHTRGTIIPLWGDVTHCCSPTCSPHGRILTPTQQGTGALTMSELYRRRVKNKLSDRQLFTNFS